MSSYDQIVFDYMKLLNELRNASMHTFRDSRSVDVPKKPGNYLITSNEDSTIIYIGTSSNLNRRLLSQHKSGNIGGSNFRRTVAIHFLKDRAKKASRELEDRISQYILQNFSFQFILIDDYVERIKFEHFSTAILSPVLNLLPQKTKEPSMEREIVQET